jgi:ubiquitin C
MKQSNITRFYNIPVTMPSLATTATASSNDAIAKNPLKTDPVLVNLLKRLSSIHKYKTFHRWKKKFLDRMLPHLKYEKGIEPAKQTCDEFFAILQKTAKQGTKVVDFLESGELTPGKTSVKANLSLREFCNQIQSTVDKLDAWIPMSTDEEKKRGYTKFHLGASLIEHGFHHYITMKQMEDSIREIQQQIGSDVLDRQQVELFETYQTQVSRFCDVMADLNLYEIMKKCLGFATAPELEESSDDEEMIIEITDGTKTIQLEVMPSDSIGNLKTIISDELSIPVEKQLWRLNDKEIDNKDDLSLAKAGIKDKSNIFVEIQMFDITVETADGSQSLQLQVEPIGDKLSSIQQSVANGFDIVLGNQAFQYQGNDLSNQSQTFAETGILNGAKLVVRPCKIPITVHTYNGTKVPLFVDPSATTISNIKALVEKDTGVAPTGQHIFPISDMSKELTSNDNMLKFYGIQNAGDDLYMEPDTVTINIQMLDNTAPSFDIQVALLDTTDKIQELIAKQTGLLVTEQIVKYKTKDLPKGSTIKALKIQNGDVVQVKSNSIQLHIEMENGSPSFDLEVKPRHTAQQIQAWIAEKSGLRVKEQIARFKGSKLVPEDTVESMSMQDRDKVQVKANSVKLHIEMQDGSPSFDLEVKPHYTTSDIKAMVAEKSGLPVDEQIAKYMDRKMPPNSTVQEMEIQDNDSIQINPNSFNLHIEMPEDAQSFDLQVKPHLTTADIQKVIEDKTGLSVTEQKLKYKGKTMPPEKTMKKMGIKDKDTVRVRLAKIPVTVKSKKDNYDILKMMVDPLQTLLSLKKQIAEKTSVQPEQQTLTMCDGKELTHMDKTVGDIGIRAGSVLFLDGEVVIRSLGDIYVAVFLQVDKAPEPGDYQEILKPATDFYTTRLKEVYPDSFKTVHVTVRKSLWNDEKPSKNYNVYIEWDLVVHFDMNGTNIPNRNKLCTAIVQTNLMPFMQKLIAMPTPPFNMTRAAYTKQTQ